MVTGIDPELLLVGSLSGVRALTLCDRTQSMVPIRPADTYQPKNTA